MYVKKEKGNFVIKVEKEDSTYYIKSYVQKDIPERRFGINNKRKLYVYLTTNVLKAKQWSFDHAAYRMIQSVFWSHFSKDSTVIKIDTQNITKKVLRVKKLNEIFV